MVQTKSKLLTLSEFLQIPETKPASEFINGNIIQKPMPKGRHSRLQAQLCATINQVTESAKIAYAFPELRCSFGDRSIVPDVPFLAGKTFLLRIEEKFLITLISRPIGSLKFYLPINALTKY